MFTSLLQTCAFFHPSFIKIGLMQGKGYPWLTCLCRLLYPYLCNTLEWLLLIHVLYRKTARHIVLYCTKKYFYRSTCTVESRGCVCVCVAWRHSTMRLMYSEWIIVYSSIILLYDQNLRCHGDRNPSHLSLWFNYRQRTKRFSSVCVARHTSMEHETINALFGSWEHEFSRYESSTNLNALRSHLFVLGSTDVSATVLY